MSMHSRSHHQPSPRDDAAIEKSAADWIARLDRGLSPEEAAQFAQWEAVDPRHATEVGRLTATWRSLDTADEVPEIMHLARELEDKQTRLRGGRSRRSVAIALLGAAAAVAIAWTAFWWPRMSDPEAERTAAGRSYQVLASAAQRLTLADGTMVELNGDSAVEPAFTPSERRVRLVRGEVHFTVATNLARPFLVQAGDVSVRAVGTAFNVRFAATAIEVLVTEGKVRVDDSTKGETLLASADRAADTAGAEAPVLVAGQRIVISVTAPEPQAPLTAAPAEVERALAWRGTQLAFDRTTLENAVAAFNSFNRRQLVLADPALRTRRIGGTFRADNLDAFVRLLETGFDLSAERRGENEIVLSQRLE
ncbi:MAG: FecR family protein [Opitutaceae bacterium]